MSKSLSKVSPEPVEDGVAASEASQLTSAAVETLKMPSNMTIWAACLDDLTGKDKLSKMVQYSLRMLTAIDANNQQKRIFMSEGVLASRLPVYQLKFINVLHLLVKKLSLLLTSLSAYRQILRFGTLPFRFHRLFYQLRESIFILKENCDTIHINKFINYWINWDMASQLVNLYYALADEAILAFKVGVIDIKTYKHLFDLAEDHEVLSWFIMIILNLRKDFIQWQELSNKESQLVLNERIKSQTKRIVNQMQTSSPFPTPIELINKMLFVEEINPNSKLINIWKQKRIVMVDTVRLLCDLFYDAPFVFRVKVESQWKPLHLLLGVFSGALGFYKVWEAQKERLVLELNKEE